MRAPKTGTRIRREQIAEAALEIIGSEGIQSLSMAGIARRVGVVPSALYRHVQGKEAVLETVLGLLRARLSANVAAARRDAPDALGRLRALFHRHARMLEVYPAIPQVIFFEAIYLRDPERRNEVHGTITDYLGRVARLVQEGQRKGAIRQDIDPETASVLFLGALMPAAVLWNISGGNFDVADHARKSWPAFERGLTAPGTGEGARERSRSEGKKRPAGPPEDETRKDRS